MPPVFDMVSDEEMRDTRYMPPPLNSRQIPPMIIVEKGESLDEFIERKAPDFFTSLQVCFRHRECDWRPHGPLCESARKI
jgi:hypothetical protein